jgi:hypothetical protein
MRSTVLFASLAQLAACGPAPTGQWTTPSQTESFKSGAAWVQDAAQCTPDNASLEGVLQITDSELIFGRQHEALYRFSWSGADDGSGTGEAITRSYPDVTDQRGEKRYILSLDARTDRLTVIQESPRDIHEYERCDLLPTASRDSDPIHAEGQREN